MPRARLPLAILSILLIVPACSLAQQPARGTRPAPRAAVAEPAPQVIPSGEDPRIHSIVAAVSPERLERDIRTLVGFGTRHTMSDTVSTTRGIGAARRWIFAEFQRISADCGGCLEVRYISDIVRGDSTTRIRHDVNVVNVVAIQRGRTDPDRYVLLSGDIDSRVTNVMDSTSESPGANDNATGVAATLEAARVLSRHRPDASIVYAALSGEEQGLFGVTSSRSMRGARAGASTP